jgi:hypothetical protein
VQYVRDNADMADGGRNTPSNDLLNPYLDPVAFRSNFRPEDPNSATAGASAKAIDAHVFIDDDAQKYLFVAVETGYGKGTNYIAALELDDWFTPKYDTVRQITENGAYTVSKTPSESVDYEVGSGINEGPFVLKHDGKYYLTFSIFGYDNKNYSVVQAVADAPLGPYTKLRYEDGGVILSADGGGWDHVSGTGHHSFIQAGDELLIYYHEHVERVTGGQVRAFALDRVTWVQNGAGDTVLYVNGPTWSIQPQLHIKSEYKNIAGDAVITATNAKDGSDVSALNDGLLSLYSFIDYVPEFRAKNGETVITIKFADYRAAAAIMIYNSKTFDEAFGRISRIEFDFKNDKVKSGIAYIDDLAFDWNFYQNWFNDSMRPGGSATAEFDELLVKEIRVTIKTALPDGVTADDFAVAVSEITILGK